jgi:hypothetical protein
MAAFCRYWRCMPRDIDTLSPAEYHAMILFADRDIRAQNRAARKRS